MKAILNTLICFMLFTATYLNAEQALVPDISALNRLSTSNKYANRIVPIEFEDCYLTKNFISSKNIDWILELSKSCLGYYGFAGNPGEPRYVVIYKDNAGNYYLDFFKYDYKNQILKGVKKEALPEDTAKYLLLVLKEQIDAKEDYIQFVSDGTPLEFGIRKGETFDHAGINSRGVGYIAMMREIAFSNNLEEINNIIKEYRTKLVKRHDNGELVSLNLNEEDAIKLAEIYLVKIYGKENIKRELPLKARKEDDSFVVMGRLPKNSNGGVAEIKIRRSDGKVLFYTHGK